MNIFGSKKNQPIDNSFNESNELFAKEPDFNLDFSKYPDGFPVERLLRVQNGIDFNNYNPQWTGERELYTADEKNVRIENGVLVLQARVEKISDQGQNFMHTSGRVDTQAGEFAFAAKYGKFVVRAKLPSGIGTWPAIWMLPIGGAGELMDQLNPEEQSSDLKYQAGGEIDIMEFLGTDDGKFYSTAHTFHSIINRIHNSGEIQLQDLSENYHEFGVEWLPNRLIFTLDNKRVYSIDRNSDDFRYWPFYRPFYIILNLAMGGIWNDQQLGLKKALYRDGIDDSQEQNWKFSIASVRHFPYLPSSD